MLLDYRLFQMVGATGKAWPPTVDSFTDGTSVSVDWTYHRHRQPAHRSSPSPEQAMWILLARSARLCSAGGGRGRAVIQKNQQQFNPRPVRTAPAPVDGDSSRPTVCGGVHMTDKCPIAQHTWPIKTS